jgi:hypothetical protein
MAKLLSTQKCTLTDLLGCVCIGLVERALLPLAISLVSVAPVSEHSSCPYMAATHYCQNSSCSL